MRPGLSIIEDFLDEVVCIALTGVVDEVLVGMGFMDVLHIEAGGDGGEVFQVAGLDEFILIDTDT